MRNVIIGLACTLWIGGAAACSRDSSRDTTSSQVARTEPPTHVTVEEEQMKTVEVELETAQGTELEGTAEMKETAGGVQISLEVEDAPPGKHGVHIHERGDCSDIPGESMGQHYAPTAEEHGLPYASAHHLGDLGNIEVDQEGKGKLSIVVPQATLKQGGAQSFLGKALVVHASEDKGVGPSGQSGTPIACGVIKE